MKPAKDYSLPENIPAPTRETIPVSRIDYGNNYRRTFSIKSINELTDSILSCGQLEDISLERIGCGENLRYLLVSGERRFHALKRGRIPYARAQVYSKLTSEQRLLLQLEENTQEPVSQNELAESYWKRYLLFLSKQTGKEFFSFKKYSTYEQIPDELKKEYSAANFAADIHRDEETMRHAFSYQRLSKEVKELVKNGVMKYGLALQIARVEEKEQAILATRVINEHKSASALRKELDSKNSTEPATEKSYSPLQAKVSGFYNAIVASIRIFDSYLVASRKVPEITQKRMFKASKPLGTLFWSLDSLIEDFKAELEARNPLMLLRVESSLRKKYPSAKELLRNIENGNYTGKPVQGEEIHDFLKSAKLIPNYLVDKIHRDPENPRKTFNKIAMQKLYDSFQTIGQLNAIIVRPHPSIKGEAMIVAGERRWRTAKKLGWNGMKVIYANLTDEQALEIQYEENTKIPPKAGERAEGIYPLYLAKLKEHGTKYKLSSFVKEYSWLTTTAVRESILYCTLEQNIKELHINGLLDFGQALEIAKLPEESRFNWAITSISNGLTASELSDKIKKGQKHANNRDLFAINAVNADGKKDRRKEEQRKVQERKEHEDAAARTFTRRLEHCLLDTSSRLKEAVGRKSLQLYSKTDKKQYAQLMFDDFGRCKTLLEFQDAYENLGNLFKTVENNL